MTDGSNLPIVSLKDGLGDETYNVEEAAFVVAAWPDGWLFTIEVSMLGGALSVH